MSQMEKLYALPGDYQKVRVETISLVNAVSNEASGYGNLQAGISLIYPAENLSEDGKAFARIFFVSPVELIKNTLEEKDIASRFRELAANTPIRLDTKKNQLVFLDVTSQDYVMLQHRLVSTIMVARNNFRKDIAELVAIFDGLTQPGATPPSNSTFHIQAAFDNRELLDAYKVTNSMPVLPPSITSDTRDMLTRRGISSHGVAERGAQGLMHGALPANAQQLREAAQGGKHGREVQIVLHVLGAAIMRGEIPNLVMNEQFRDGLAQLIDQARVVPVPEASTQPQLTQ